MTTRARLGVILALMVAVVWASVQRSFEPPTVDGAVVTATVTASVPASSDGQSPGVPASSASPGTDPEVGAGSGEGGGTIAGGGGSFTISGGVSTVLEPGVTAPIGLTVSNPTDRPIRITGLSIAIASVGAPRATSALPCTSADFAVSQPQVAGALTVPANSSRTLQQLGLTGSQLPSLGMLNSIENQDGCQGAAVRLSYGGTAVWGDL
jgi:hypothetical protein